MVAYAFSRLENMPTGETPAVLDRPMAAGNRPAIRSWRRIPVLVSSVRLLATFSFLIFDIVDWKVCLGLDVTAFISCDESEGLFVV